MRLLDFSEILLVRLNRIVISISTATSVELHSVFNSWVSSLSLILMVILWLILEMILSLWWVPLGVVIEIIASIVVKLLLRTLSDAW